MLCLYYYVSSISKLVNQFLGNLCCRLRFVVIKKENKLGANG